VEKIAALVQGRIWRKHPLPSPELPVGPRLVRVLKIALRALLPVLMEGRTGVGKSEIVAQVAHWMRIRLIVLDLSVLEPPDLVGIPVVHNGRTSYATPSIFPTAGRGIVLLEELGRADIATRQPALQLLTARRIHEYELPPRWVVWATTNPADGDYHVTPLDPALLARFLFLKVRAERKWWLEWADTAGIHPAVLHLARTHDQFLDPVPPRTWCYVSNVLHQMEPSELGDEGLLYDVLGSTIGPPWVELLLQALERPEGDPTPEPQRLLAAYHTDAELQEFVRDCSRLGRTDRLATLARQLERALGEELLQLVADRAFRLEAFEALLADLPGDLRERLQEVFAANPVSTALIDVGPKETFDGYATSQGGPSVARRRARRRSIRRAS
jgi:hypothetical protein